LENSDKQWISKTTGVDRRMAVSEQAVYTSHTFFASKVRPGSPLRGVSNHVTDTAGPRRVFKELGIQIRAQLDRIHQKE